MPGAVQRSDVAVLLRTEHAAGRALAAAAGEQEAYAALLEAIGSTLGWQTGDVWTPDGRDPPALRCVADWAAPRERFADLLAAGRALTLVPGQGLAGRVWEGGEPAWVADLGSAADLPRMQVAAKAGLRTAFAFPVRGAAGPLAIMEFGCTARLALDPDLLATMTSLGSQIGQFVERDRAQRAVRESDARKSAILNAAFDCIITMDHRGRVVEVNAATETTFGYAAGDMVGRELACLIVPPSLRRAHRHGLDRYLATGQGRIVGHPLELTAMRADGSEFPVELAVTRPDVSGPPLFCGYLRDVTERRRAELALRQLADEQAALRRVATAVAAEQDQQRVFGLVTEEVGRLLGAQTSNLVRFNGDDTATVVGGWSAGGARNVPVGDTVRMDGDTASARVWRTGRPARVDSYAELGGSLAAQLRGLGFRAAVSAPVALGGALWGAVIVSSVEGPFPPGAEQRIADFAELIAQALANAEAHAELAASRARIVEAADAERRRLERNLHDGAQQRLVSLSLTLGLAARRVAGDPEAKATLERAREDLGLALEELRELARGIHPAVLTDRGLEPALSALAARSPVPVDLAIELEARLPEPVEAAAYYVVAEALTNAARHAHATAVRVEVGRTDGHASVQVADDGVGGAGTECGSGLRGLADRVEALGGRLLLDSRAGVGTTLRAEIPAG